MMLVDTAGANVHNVHRHLYLADGFLDLNLATRRKSLSRGLMREHLFALLVASE